MKKLIYLILLVLCFSCKPAIIDLQSGQIYQIPFSGKFAIGTDSTIIILDREEGKVTVIIDRKGSKRMGND